MISMKITYWYSVAEHGTLQTKVFFLFNCKELMVMQKGNQHLLPEKNIICLSHNICYKYR